MTQFHYYDLNYLEQVKNVTLGMVLRVFPSSRMPRLLILWLVAIASLLSIGLAQQEGYYNQQWDDRWVDIFGMMQGVPNIFCSLKYKKGPATFKYLNTVPEYSRL